MLVPGNGQQAPESILVRRLVEQGIRDARVLAAFARVPRRAFVPPEAREVADEDRALDIGRGQTISQPYVVARMTEALALAPGDRVLEVGTGSGYQTAILAELLPAPNVVRSIEIIPELSARAGRVLAELGYANVELAVGDGGQGWPAAAPFDAILVAAAPERLPPALLDQLAIGGRLCIPIGPTGGNQDLELWTRLGPEEYQRRSLFPVRFVPLTGQAGGALS